MPNAYEWTYLGLRRYLTRKETLRAMGRFASRVVDLPDEFGDHMSHEDWKAYGFRHNQAWLELHELLTIAVIVKREGLCLKSVWARDWPPIVSLNPKGYPLEPCV